MDPASMAGLSAARQIQLGLRTRYAVYPQNLIADSRKVERVCREEEPDPAFAFVDHVQPVTDSGTLADLNADFEELLGWDADVAAEYLVPVVPGSVPKRYHQAHSITVKIGSAGAIRHGALGLDDILRRTRLQREGTRLAALGRGRISLNSDEDERHLLGGVDADHWLEANLSLGPRRFVLLDGEWFEIGAEYVRTSRHAIARLFPTSPPSRSPRGPAFPSNRSRLQRVRRGPVPGTVPMPRQEPGNAQPTWDTQQPRGL
jgi:uncharacterized protein (TIGR04141 family)